MKGVKSLIAGACSLLSAILISIVLDMDTLRTNMIVEFGIIATNNVRLVLLGVSTAGGSAAIAWGLYQLVPTIIKNSSEEKLKRSSLAYRAKSSGPKEIREQLTRLKEARPRLSSQIVRCLEQMDDMSGMLSRFEQLISSNEAEGMTGALVGLKEIEGTMCANFKWVINSIIAADDDAIETRAFYQKCIERIDRVIAANARALEKGNEFLLEIADSISQVGESTVITDAWIVKIRAQNEKSRIETEELR